MQACDRREMTNGAWASAHSRVLSNAMTRGGEFLQNRAGRLMKTGIVEHDQELGRQATRPCPQAFRSRQEGAQNFKIRASKLMQATILEYDQSLVRGAGGDGSPPVAT